MTAQIRHVRTVVAAPGEPCPPHIHPVEYDLEPMQFAIVTVKATERTVERRLVVADANKVGGVCDDCTSFNQDDVVRAEIYQVLIDP